MTAQDHRMDEPVNAPISPKPPVILALFMAAAALLEYVTPLIARPRPEPRESEIVGGVIMACAFLIAALAAREMRRKTTTILPGGKASSLVQTGVFAKSRNPIYLAMTFLMLGIGIAFARPWFVVLAAVFLFYIQERVVKREETYLAARFGPDYGAYRRKVRRWF